MIHFKNQKNIGIILKGKSIQQISKVYERFKCAFIVNNFDLEIPVVGKYLRDKNIVQFVNKLSTATMKRANYKALKIQYIQSNLMDHSKNHVMINKVKGYYTRMGLKFTTLPNILQKYNEFFIGKGRYKYKHPNTGILAICYAIELIKPKNIYIVGLDLYQQDYLFRRSHQNPLRVQQAKMKRTKMVDYFNNLTLTNPNINFTIGTNNTHIKERNNVRILI